MEQKYVSRRVISLIVLTTFGLLLFGSIIFYKQRMLFNDAAFIPFRIINNGTLQIQAQRYGSFVTQIFPWLLSYFHCSLNTILLVYSMSFCAFYAFVGGLLIFRYKQVKLAILLLFYFLIFVSDGYFWTNNEVHQGIGWMFLFLGIFFKKGQQERIGWGKAVLLAILGVLAIFSHHLVVIPFSFLWLYFWLDKNGNGLPAKRMWGYAILLLLIFVLKQTIGSDSGYDQDKLHNITHISFERIFDTFSSGQSKSFFYLVGTNYWISILILSASVVALVIRRQFPQLTLVVFYCFLYFILICITYPKAFDRGTRFYMESEWQGLAIIIAAPLAFWLVQSGKKYLAAVALIVIVGTRLVYIGLSAPIFIERLHFSEKILAAMRSKNIHKIALLDGPATKGKFIMAWGTPVETLFMSVLHKDSVNYTFKLINPSEMEIVPEKATKFMSSFRVIDNSDLNSFYFTPDSLHSYKVMTYRALMAE